MDEHQYWLGFSLVSGIGPKRLADLRARFSTLEIAWKATATGLREAGLNEALVEGVVKARQQLNLAAELDRILDAGIRLVTLDDAQYPRLLRDIDDPPLLLYVRGQLLSVDERAVAIVGTRKASRYGRDVSYRLAKGLATQGITVISGLAQGVDAAAHQGALDSGGRTIAILGSGLDNIYPTSHRKLADRVVQQGAVISEFPLGMKPLAANFPIRNRIVSGMSLAVLVTEAPEKSGALITASIAADQGREVFAVPANIFSASGRGTNRLIQDGARLVMDVADVMDELNMAYDTVQVREQATKVAPESEMEHQVLNYLQADPIHIDELVRISGLTIVDVTSTLTILELKGLAQMVGHMQYSRMI